MRRCESYERQGDGGADKALELKVIMHINRRGWHTAEALPKIIDGVRHKGFTFVTVGELIGK